MAALAFVAVALGLARPSVADASSIRRFALVIASNSVANPGLAPLRYADDDAAKMVEFLRAADVETRLLARLDQDTQQRFPDLVGEAAPATLEGLRRAHAQLESRMREAASEGSVEFIIYYSGHGDVDESGRTYLTLDDGKFGHDVLFADMLRRSPAARNHVVIDACRSRAFVESRGGTWRPDRNEEHDRAAVQALLDAGRLDAFPNTGILVAESSEQRTHEWERYAGGVFTHQLLSGLRGAADVNGDGRIEYSELGAFVSAANRGVDDPRARLSVWVRPPAIDARAAWIVHGHLERDRLAIFDGDDHAHYVVEDERGVRLADLRREGSRPSYVRLPAGRIYLRRRGSRDRAGAWFESTIAADHNGSARVGELEFVAARHRPRGALNEALHAGLFRTGFGPSYYAGYTAAQGLLPVADMRWQGRRAWSTVPKAVSQEQVRAAPTSVTKAATAHVPAPPDDPPRRRAWSWDSLWHGISVGTSFALVMPRRVLSPDRDLVRAHDMTGLQGRETRTPVRGFELRWSMFSARDRKAYPAYDVFLRVGIDQYHASFGLGRSDPRIEVGDATDIDVVSVPVYVAASFYPFHDWPVRPLIGLGLGLSVSRIDWTIEHGLPYDRREGDHDLSVRFGFELHTGIDLRVSNVFSLQAELRQTWSIRHQARNLDLVPAVALTGASVVTSLSIAFPGHRR